MKRAIATALLLGVTLGFGFSYLLWSPTPTHAGTSQWRLSASAVLESATEHSPFAILTPSWLPTGMSLDKVITTGPPETPEGIFSVDVFYRTIEGQTLHIWETNIPDLASSGKDPVQIGTAVTIAGRTWAGTTNDLGAGMLQILSARFPGGVTVSMDTTLDKAALERVAAVLR
jgi:hypothetical protein